MAIPKEILDVERPKNTVVKATRNPDVFSVVKRTSKRVPGKKNPVPVEIGVIGKICNKKYIPNPEKKEFDTDFKIYGDFALCDKVGESILQDLYKHYSIDNARKLYCIALLRTINPDIVNEEIQTEYKTSYISEVYPKVALSPNTISTFLEETGKHINTIDEFMNDRIAKYAGNNTVIDGMLKNNNSETNIYSAYSRKGRVKGTEDVNLIYAYDVNIKEPVACSVYPGNMLDFSALKKFIEDHPIKNGFVIMDKGFRDCDAENEIAALESKYLIPIKNSLKVISKLKLDKNYTDSFSFEEDVIRCKKVKDADKYYYAFKSAEMKSNQEKGYVLKSYEKGTFKESTYTKKSGGFGLIVFESNADLDMKDIYYAYQNRWEIETMFNNYKNIINRQEVNVHGNYRLFATEFINFLSTVISMRVRKLLVETKVSEKYTQKQVMRLLSKYAKKRNVKNNEEWSDCARLKYVEELCSALSV